MTTVPSRVGITGALGFIGGTLRQRFESSGAEVVGVDQIAAPAVYPGDIAEPGVWGAALENRVAATYGRGRPGP